MGIVAGFLKWSKWEAISRISYIEIYVIQSLRRRVERFMFMGGIVVKSARMCKGARVCLDRHHIPPISVTIRQGERQMGADVEREATDERTRNAWANEIDTTEAGAYACVLAAVELFDGLVTVKRQASFELPSTGFPFELRMNERSNTR